MSEAELCESCGENPAEDESICPYLEAKLTGTGIHIEPCNCCVSCYAKCKEKS